MSETPIVNAEVVEVPKPEWPELWVAMMREDHGNGSISYHTTHGWITKGEAEEAAADIGIDPERYARIPGTQAQPAPSEADAVTELCGMKQTERVYIDREPGGFQCIVYGITGDSIAAGLGDTPQAAAARCLAKIRGGR